MNIYFLVEGAITEKRFYPALVDYIFDGKLNKLVNVYDVNSTNDGFFVLSGNGYPQIYQILEDTILDINTYSDFNYLFVSLDADERTIEETVQEFTEEIEKLKVKGIFVPEPCEIVLVVQNRCIETWFLGNSAFFRRQTSNPEMLKFHHFFNVRINDPEEMGFDENFSLHAGYHYSYFKQMALENNERYSKSNPLVVCSANFISNLITRYNETDHIKSFKKLCDKLEVLNQKLVNR